MPVLRDRLGIVDEPLLGQGARVAGHVTAVLIGLVLLLLARQLARRKRLAWQAAVALFALSAVVQVLKGPHPVAVLLAAAMVVALVWCRDAFVARGDPQSLLGLLRFVPLWLGAVLAFGFVSLLLERDRISPDLTLGGMLETTFGGLIGLDGPYTYEDRFFRDFFPDALLALGIAGLVVIALHLFRTVAQRASASASDRERARELFHRYGSDTLAPFALRDDKSYFFASDGQAMIAYAWISGYALASADPIGAPASIGRVLDEFLAFCRARAWRVAFLAVRESDLPLYRRRGFTGVYMGDEAIVRCDRFTLAGSPMKAVRSAVSRVGRTHHFKLMRESDASPELVGRLNAISEAWRGKEPERGFTMALSKDVEGRQEDFLLALALDGEERPAGFLRLVPCYGDDPGYSLDLMRRLPDSANGLTEFLIAQSALELGAQGFRRLSMNFAAWGRLFADDAKLTLRQRALRAVASALNPFFQIQSLHDFNQKLAPEWLPRSIVIEDAAAAPTVALMYASVEGFVKLPFVGRYLVPAVRS